MRTILEDCTQFWCPYFQTDIEKLKEVQKRATKLSKGWRKFLTMRLKEINQFSLSKRRLRDDLITEYKYLQEKKIPNPKRLFNIAQKLETSSNGWELNSN